MHELGKLLVGIVVLVALLFVFLNALPSLDAAVPSDTTVRMEAPELQGIEAYINSAPFTLSEHVGQKVILIDFWTYTCINCIRTLPYLKSWHAQYADDGLLIVGVHAPEFEFEKRLENVQAAVQQYGIPYPVVLDNDHATWNAYHNRYWPAKYLINKEGRIVYTHFGEGAYDETERQIVAALEDLKQTNITRTHAAVNATDVNFFQIGTPELYFGHSFRRAPIGNAPFLQPGESYSFAEPDSIAPNLIYLSGTWQNGPDHMVLESEDGKIILQYHAKVVNLVMAGDAELEVFLDGQRIGAEAEGVDVQNGVARISEERLYNLVNGPDYSSHTLELRIHGPLRAYAFTFG
ncbi:MAG TPA: redoxin family protein [Candidatus Bilamarchaeaceae archaeon]|nr:redoxin family protein [Candidatus Bilamarchaeaceae archaeon]